jgi:hypothetical protein
VIQAIVDSFFAAWKSITGFVAIHPHLIGAIAAFASVLFVPYPDWQAVAAAALAVFAAFSGRQYLPPKPLDP